MKEWIGFYKAHDAYGFCSNFYEAPIVIDNVVYKTSEHYYQSLKFPVGSKPWIDIVNSSTPQEVVKIARKVKFDIPNWDEIKYDIMKRAVYNKFYQHKYLADLLKNTGDLLLVEDTVDTIRPDAWWGNGADGNGRNWLGLILMEVRSTL